MFEIIVIVESNADAQTAIKLAERVLVEKVDWLEHELLSNFFQWSGLDVGTEYSCWKNIKNIMHCARESGLTIPKYLGHGKSGVLKADGAAAMKILNFIRLLQRKNNRPIKVVLLIRDLDNQPERREGIEQARAEHIDRQPKVEIIIGAADRMREAWVLNGFIASNQEEVKKISEH